MFKFSRVFLVVLIGSSVACAEPAEEEVVPASIATPSMAQYCEQTQQRMLDSKLSVSNQIHTDYAAFVKSKPAAQPLTTHQYESLVHFPDKKLDMAALMSCKFKSLGALTEVLELSENLQQPDCASLIRQRLVKLRADLGDRATLGAEQTRVIDDETAAMGPKWLNPWPFDPVNDEEGATIIRGKSLFVAHDSLIPMPKRFKGTFYCHLPSDLYLTALLTGELSASDEFVLVELDTAKD